MFQANQRLRNVGVVPYDGVKILEKPFARADNRRPRKHLQFVSPVGICNVQSRGAAARVKGGKRRNLAAGMVAPHRSGHDPDAPGKIGERLLPQTKNAESSFPQAVERLPEDGRWKISCMVVGNGEESPVRPGEFGQGIKDRRIVDLGREPSFPGPGNRCFEISDDEIAIPEEFDDRGRDLESFAAHIHDVPHKTHSHAANDGVQDAIFRQRSNPAGVCLGDASNIPPDPADRFPQWIGDAAVMRDLGQATFPMVCVLSVQLRSTPFPFDGRLTIISSSCHTPVKEQW